ncbi:MAG: hypothetical protein H0T46_17145 [Deltaproteobacteria bacterium]|nr:hypothetical protein [Deltaproteobacteria bacterium]
MSTPVNPLYADEFRQAAHKAEAKGKNDQPFEAPHRIPPFASTVDVGEQVVGSDHLFEIGMPTMLDNFRGTGRVVGSSHEIGAGPLAYSPLIAAAPPAADAFSAETGANGTPLEIDAFMAAPIRCRFRPLSAGSFRSQINIQILWSDGGRTNRSVLVTGRARNLEDVPNPSQVDPSRAAVPSDAPDAPTTVASPDESFATATRRAGDNAEGLANAQRDGVNTAEKEAESFKEEIPEGPWWGELAAFAISMGVAGVAAVVAKAFATKSLAWTKGITDKDGKADLQKTALFIATVDTLKEGIKNGNKLATAAAMKPRKPKTPTQSPGGGQFSSNSGIDFWAAQRNMLTTIAADNRELVTHAFARLEKAPPDDARLGMQAIADGLASARGGSGITLAQQLASETQWVAGIARGSKGESTAKNDHGEVATTNLDKFEHKLHFEKVNGVLRLQVSLPDLSRPADAAVNSASITGISQEIADRLRDNPLGRLPIPIVLQVTTKQGEKTFTRDEAGRIRVDQNFFDDPSTEPQQIQDATRLFAHVLSKSLSGWGLPEIHTDDASKRGDP